MAELMHKFGDDESGATAIEYGLIAALVAVAVIASLGMLKDALAGTFNKVATTLNGI